MCSSDFHTTEVYQCTRASAYLALVFLVCAIRWSRFFAADQDVPFVSLREEASSYEHGDGIARDGARAVVLYCQAARLGDAAPQFSLGWIYANGRGVPRDDAIAAFFFAAAAEQGIAPAQRMLKQVGHPTTDAPASMRHPVVARPPSEDAAVVPFQIQTKAPKVLVDLVKKMGPDYRVEPQLVLAIMALESNFDSTATSPKNAMGLMQLIPETATRFNVRNAYDPRQSLRGGLAYLRWLLAYFEGDLTLVAAAYNAGEGAVERYRGVPPYAETRSYVRRILEAVGTTMHPFDASITAPSAQLSRIRDAMNPPVARSH
ncbi:MAG: transglycosylase SLT domain-containing protein [Variovorax sp.]|nr:transglycosylase SLT domain-containing protein [Variovorax sp.]